MPASAMAAEPGNRTAFSGCRRRRRTRRPSRSCSRPGTGTRHRRSERIRSRRASRCRSPERRNRASTGRSAIDRTAQLVSTTSRGRFPVAPDARDARTAGQRARRSPNCASSRAALPRPLRPRRTAGRRALSSGFVLGGHCRTRTTGGGRPHDYASLAPTWTSCLAADSAGRRLAMGESDTPTTGHR